MSNKEWRGAEESGPNIALRDQIEHLAERDSTVHQALRLSRSGRCTYEESLQMAVIQLAAIASAHEKTLIDFAMRQPGSQRDDLFKKTAQVMANYREQQKRLNEQNLYLMEALELVIEEMAPTYHDCIDDGLQECAWCVARAVIARAKGEA